MLFSMEALTHSVVFSRTSSMAIPLSHSPTRTSLPLPYSAQWLVRPPGILTPAKLHSKQAQNLTLILRRSAASASASASPQPPVVKKRMRYRKRYPGESEGITEEMRFVAMRLRNVNGKKSSRSDSDSDGGEDSGGDSRLAEGEEGEAGGGESESDGGEADTWQPSMKGFLNYLVDSEVVFNTVERIVDESNDVAYAYFRKTGLERSEGLAKDLEWFREQGMVIPEPSNPGVSYGKYLEELSEKSAPLFLCHFYNIYFSHIAGGQAIGKQVSERLLDGKELEFYRWEGHVPELLKGVREKLNMLGEHWSRDEKNKCLKEAAKSFRFLGQIVRLIIL